MLDLDSPLAAAQSNAYADPAPALPPQPKSVRETGLEQQLIAELIAKAIFVSGKTHLPMLTTRLRLSINVLREVLDFMVAEHLAEIAWRGESDIDVQYQLTAAGKQRAGAWFERCRYVGPAPVTLDAYRAAVERQSAQPPVTADDLAAELVDDGLAPAVREQLGAALYSGRALLLYGPPGGGKSTLARKLGRLQQGLIAVPYAVVVGQEIIQVHDTTLHLPPSPLQAMQECPTPERRSSDLRWALCRRPVVMLGAELSEDMLDLRPDVHSGCHQAPPHLKANNGLFIIDDLGRQRLAAGALLNRYLEPLARGLDQLSLQGGQQFTVPFDVTLVLATNLDPAALLDASALRRLGYKVRIGPLGEASYRQLFRQQCRVAGIACDDVALRYLIEELHRGSGQPLLACHPRELLGRIADFAGFSGAEARLTVAALDQAWSSLFATCAPATDERGRQWPESIV